MNAQLQAATARRHADVVARADAALQAMSRRGEPITFTAVARAANVSTDFLYRHTRLRAQIEDLRCSASSPRRQPAAAQPGATCDTSSAVRLLSAQIKQMRAAHRDELHRLERALAAAHGENLRLRRTAQAHTSSA